MKKAMIMMAVLVLFIITAAAAWAHPRHWRPGRVVVQPAPRMVWPGCGVVVAPPVVAPAPVVVYKPGKYWRKHRKVYRPVKYRWSYRHGGWVAVYKK